MSEELKPVLFGNARDFIAENAMKDPSYNPYCGRCPGLVRMVKIEPFYWRCSCGAIHDIRPSKENSDVRKAPRSEGPEAK